MICAFCRSHKTHEVIDFGEEALAGGFLKREQFEDERFYPLRLFFCETCAAVQLADRVSPNDLFRDYYYKSSATATACEHFMRYADEVEDRFRPRSVLEIGCNDGVMLKHFAGCDRVVGVDPSSVSSGVKIEGVEIVNDFFGAHLGLKDFDLVVANNVFAHVEDIHGLTEAVRDALAPNGVFVLEVHHLLAMVEDLQYDWIYHEHLFYYSVLSLAKLFRRHGLSIFDVERHPLHGGSIRAFVAKDGRHVSHRVGDVMGLERLHGLDRPETFENFAWSVKDHAGRFGAALRRQRDAGRLVAGYGASGRANALIQHCGLDHDLLHCMFDDSPARCGLYTPGVHLLVNAGERLREMSIPDDLVLFAWSYEQEIGKKLTAFRGNVFVPLPELRMTRYWVNRGVEMAL